MFSTENFSPNYAAPATASYGTLRQSRNNAAAEQAYASNARQFQAPQANRGLSADSKALQYRTNVESDQASVQGDAALNKTYLDQIKQNQDATLTQQSELAQQQAGKRDLMYGSSQQQQQFDLTKESDAMQQILADLSRNTQQRIGQVNRDSNMTKILLGGLIA